MENERKLIVLRWNTGKIELCLDNVLNIKPAELKKLVDTATVNHAEVCTEISDYISSIISEIVEFPGYDKRIVERYKKLAAVVQGEKQTKEEKAVARIIKSETKNHGFQGGIFEDAGKYCVTDGYRLVRFENRPKGFENAERTFPASKVIGDISDYSVELILPSLKELKADIKLSKAGKATANRVHCERILLSRGKVDFKYIYDFGYGLPKVNALHLVDMLEALPNSRAFAKPNNKTIYFNAGNNDGILLGCRVPNGEYEAEPVEPVDSSVSVESVVSDFAVDSVETVRTVKAVETYDIDVHSEQTEKTERANCTVDSTYNAPASATIDSKQTESTDTAYIVTVDYSAILTAILASRKAELSNKQKRVSIKSSAIDKPVVLSGPHDKIDCFDKAGFTVFTGPPGPSELSEPPYLVCIPSSDCINSTYMDYIDTS